MTSATQQCSGDAGLAIDDTHSAGLGNDATLEDSVRAAAGAGISRINVLAYRDLDDSAAGGSELHAHEVLSRWAGAGLTVRLRTVQAPGHGERTERAGYQVRRSGGRSLGVPQIALEGMRRRLEPADALVEIWNGVPFFSPLWWRGPRLVVLHHLHDELWKAFYPAPIDRIGSTVERKIAPLAYRKTSVATLAPSGRDDLIARTPLRAEQVHVVRPGIDPFFGDQSRHIERGPDPTLLAVGRLTSAKRFDLAIRTVKTLVDEFPSVRLVIIGEGPEQAALATLAEDLGVAEHVSFLGRVGRDELADWYRRAWVLLATSVSEGWGMTLTEAAASGTPAVASDIVGHRDAMGPGAGILAASDLEFESGVRKMLDDAEFRSASGATARQASLTLDWDRTAAQLLDLLVGFRGTRPGG